MKKKELESILKKLPHRLVVNFAYLCAKDLDKYYNNEKYPEVFSARAECLELIEKWLKDSSSVSKLELNTAATYAHAASSAYMAQAAASSSASAAYAANAAASAYTAHVASSAAHTAYTASTAAYTAATAANATAAAAKAAYAAYITDNINAKDILQLALGGLTDFEKELYDVKTIIKEISK